MKKTTMNLSFEAEKLNAIRRYMAKKDQALEEELGEFMQRLYEKHVPANVREYIEDRDNETEEVPPRRPAHSGSNAVQ